MFKKLFNPLIQWKLKRSYKNAVKLAELARKRHLKKHYVILEKGSFKVYAGQELHYLHSKGYFKPGVSLRQILAIAVYKTK